MVALSPRRLGALLLTAAMSLLGATAPAQGDDLKALVAGLRKEIAEARWGENAWSVQFHPEMRALETQLSVHWRRARILAEGDDPVRLAAEVDDAERSREVLRRFVGRVRGA